MRGAQRCPCHRADDEGKKTTRVCRPTPGHQAATRWDGASAPSWECPAAVRGTRVRLCGTECPPLGNRGFLLQQDAPSPTPAFCSRVSSAGYSTRLAGRSLVSWLPTAHSRLRCPWRPGRGPRLLPAVLHASLPTQGPRTSTGQTRKPGAPLTPGRAPPSTRSGVSWCC